MRAVIVVVGGVVVIVILRLRVRMCVAVMVVIAIMFLVGSQLLLSGDRRVMGIVMRAEGLSGGVFVG